MKRIGKTSLSIFLVILCFFCSKNLQASDLNGLPSMIGVGALSEDFKTTNTNALCTKEFASVLMSSIRSPYFHVLDLFKSNYTDVDSKYGPYAAFCAEKGIIESQNSTHFGAKETMSKTKYLSYILSELGYESSESNAFDTAVKVLLLTKAEADTIQNTDFTIGHASYLLRKALITVPNGKSNVVFAEILAERDLIYPYHVTQMGFTYKNQLKTRYYELTKNQAPVSSSTGVPAYIKEISDIEGAMNLKRDMLIFNDKIYYLLSSSASYDKRIIEYNLSTGATRTVCTIKNSLSEVVLLQEAYGNYLYYSSSHSSVLNSGIFTGVTNATLTQVNLNTLQKTVLADKKINALTGSTSFHITNQYIYFEEQSRNLYVMNRNGLKGTWKKIKSASSYANFYVSMGTHISDNNLYATVDRQNGTSPYLVKIDPTGRETKLANLSQAFTYLNLARDWIYLLDGSDYCRINKNTGKYEKLDYFSINIQYPWVYYMSEDGCSRKLIGYKSGSEATYIPSYAEDGYFYKDKVYYIHNTYNQSQSVSYFTMMAVDLNTYETSEVYNTKKEVEKLIKSTSNR